jgi:hypothetical protein
MINHRGDLSGISLTEGDKPCRLVAMSIGPPGPAMFRIPADLLRRAARIRQHALHFVDDPIAEHLGKYADELEARAARLAGE